MKKQLILALKKDILEYIREKKFFLYSGTLLCITIIMILVSRFLPDLMNAAINNIPHIISNVETIVNTISDLFPNNIKENIGIFSSEIIIFYGSFVIFSTYNIISNEIKRGKWILPLCSGYKPITLVLSKSIVYPFFIALPCFIFYNFYYLICISFLENNYYFTTVIINSFILFFIIFFSAFATILLSIIYSKPFLSATTMFVYVAVAPDIFVLFSFGKFLPTHLFSYLYMSGCNFIELIIPILLCVVLSIILIVLTIRKLPKICMINRFEN